MANPVALPGLNDTNPVRQNTAIRQISERLEADYAPLADPVFTGDPQAPTPTLTDNDTSIATTAFVKGQNYTTKTYVDSANSTQDTAIAGKAATVHTHAESDVTSLVTDLANKEPKITGSGNATDYWGGDKAFHAVPSQKLVASYVNTLSTVTSVSTAIPYDNTVPQSTEGTQIFSRSVTTTSSTQIINVVFHSSFSLASTSNTLGVALFNGSTCIGAAGEYGSLANVSYLLTAAASVAPGAAGTYTISARVGPQTAGSFNLNAAGYGGAAQTVMITTVIEP